MKPEDEILKEEIARLEHEVEALVPFEWAPGIIVRVEPIFSQVDQKAENCKEGNTSQKKCPKCHLLPRQYKSNPQDPLGGGGPFCPKSLFDLTFSPLHFGPRVGEHLIRLSCLVHAFGDHLEAGNTCGPTHPQYQKYLEKKEMIKNHYMNRPNDKPKVVLYRVVEGGIGNSNTGGCFK